MEHDPERNGKHVRDNCIFFILWSGVALVRQANTWKRRPPYRDQIRKLQIPIDGAAGDETRLETKVERRAQIGVAVWVSRVLEASTPSTHHHDLSLY
jgi:hypothetical protein